MTEPPAGTPWWAWLLGLLIIVGVPALVTWLTQRPMRHTLRQVAADTAATKDQTVNAHSEAEFPNLRDEITEMRTTITASLASLREDVGGLHSESRDLRNDVLGIRTDARRDRRKLSEQEKALDDHLADVPRIIDDLLNRHVGDCPLRTP